MIDRAIANPNPVLPDGPPPATCPAGLSAPEPIEHVSRDLRRLLAEFSTQDGEAVPPKDPLYGHDAHRPRPGIHADGLNKLWWMYAPFDVPNLLDRPLEVPLTRDSGVAGLVFLIRQHLGIDVAKQEPRLRDLHDAIEQEFDAGRQTGMEWEEPQPLVARHGIGAAPGGESI